MVKRLKSGLYASSSKEVDPKLALIKRDMGRLTDTSGTNNQRKKDAEKRLKLKSYKEKDFPL